MITLQDYARYEISRIMRYLSYMVTLHEYARYEISRIMWYAVFSHPASCHQLGSLPVTGASNLGLQFTSAAVKAMEVHMRDFGKPPQR